MNGAATPAKCFHVFPSYGGPRSDSFIHTSLADKPIMLSCSLHSA